MLTTYYDEKGEQDAKSSADLPLQARPEQEGRLLETLELCRQTYNYFLARWREGVPSRLELQARLPKLKRERPKLNEV